MNGYTYSYIKSSIFALMDMTEEEMNQNNLINKIPFYLNRGMSEICSSVKPHNTHICFYVNKNMVNKPINVLSLVSDSFISFGGSASYITPMNSLSSLYSAMPTADTVDYAIKETDELKSFRPELAYNAHDKDFIVLDYDHLLCKKVGYYQISVKERWYTFDIRQEDTIKIDCPEDVLDALILYVATELWSLEDERKSTIMRNKYEMSLSRLNDSNYNNTTTFYIEGDE